MEIEARMDVEANLKSLGLSLPEPPKPVASYIPAVRAGNLLFLSGMLPFIDGKLSKTGKVGKELSVADGQEAAKVALLNALAVVKAELGSLNEVGRIVRMGVHVASAEGFTQQPAVGNGASDLLVQLFGEAGRHARLALGAAELPLGAPVELELIIQVRE
jgi:enamine deaminase RidA (YjgF/YER057c/UK114 family)